LDGGSVAIVGENGAAGVAPSFDVSVAGSSDFLKTLRFDEHAVT